MTVEVRHDRILKYGTGRTEHEAAKLRAYREFSAGFFRVPTVLAHSGDTMELERLDGFESLARWYVRPRDATTHAVFSLAGRALAQVHRRSGPDAPWVRDLLGTIQPGSVVLHGDFGFSNVLYSEARHEVALIDPIPPADDRSSDVGQPLQDLALMTSCLLGRLAAREAWRLPALPRRALVGRLLEGYRSVWPLDTDDDDIVEAGSRLLADYLGRRRNLPPRAARMLASALVRTL